MTRMKGYAVMFLCYALWLGATAEQCGRQARGALCPNGQCCSAYGWCGTTKAYCGMGCQSQCSGPTPPSPSPPPPPAGGDITKIISNDLFDQMLQHRNDPRCPGNGFYTYEAFIDASHAFSGFATTGDEVTRKREVAAFLSQTSHETSGSWPGADVPYAWGYCFIDEPYAHGSYCVPSRQYPCARGKEYYGRGPMQLSYNYNYGEASDALGLDLLTNPELISEDPLVSFKSAMWFWMTPRANKPSSHDVIMGAWKPSFFDIMAGRVPGYGAITNIINGGAECGHGFDSRAEDRVGYYRRFCDVMGIDYGEGLDCGHQLPFTLAVKSLYQMS